MPRAMAPARASRRTSRRPGGKRARPICRPGGGTGEWGGGCKPCHIGSREPVTLTAADMVGRAEFTSHPSPELLRIHNPERFGCSPCHNGNGRATPSVEKGHGLYEHWLR